MKTNLFYLFAAIIFAISVSCSEDDYEVKTDSTKWTELNRSEIENELQDICGDNNANIQSIVSGLKNNVNVEEVFTAPDKMQVITKFYDDDSYSVFPIHQPIDPFNESEGNSNEVQSVPRRKVVSLKSAFKTSGSKGKVAVFNYFSNNQYGNDKLGTRATQNQMLYYMCWELNQNDYGVEYYGYEDMTIDNILKVKSNKSKYKAVIIISHGFSDNEQSYFVIGEEYDYVRAYKQSLLKDEGFKEPFKYKFWNEGLSFKKRYDFVVPVKEMDFGKDILLYMGSCDAYRYGTDMKGTCIGWNGTNCSAQAHVAVLFHKLMRGKNLVDALDIDDEKNYFYNDTFDQIDTWKDDPVYDKTKLVYNIDYNPSQFYVGTIQVRKWANYPNYLKIDNDLARISIGDENRSILTGGVYFMKDHKFKLKFHFRSTVDEEMVSGDYVYIKATPLRGDKAPIIKKIKKSKLKKGWKINLESNGAYDITAAIDEDFKTEILIHKCLIVVYAAPFKENGIALGGDDEEGDEEEDTHEYVDLGLPSGTLWATCNVGASKPEEYGDHFAWGETKPKSDYSWSTYKWGSDYNQLTKYCTKSSYGLNGFTDNKTTLDLADDAARANWGGQWRMPTKADFDELLGNTSNQWVTNYNGTGVNGRLFTANNGRSIFLPAAGWRGDTLLNFAGSTGNYWSSSLYTDSPYYAYYLDFISGGVYIDNGSRRYRGHTVRPVRENVKTTDQTGDSGSVSGGGRS